MGKFVLYCGGQKPVIELLVTIYSLRKSFSGPIEVYIGETSIRYLSNLISSNVAKVIVVPNSRRDKNILHHWTTRWRAMSMVDGNDVVLHPDCDIIYKDGFDVSKLFDYVDSRHNYITTFHTLNDGNIYDRWHKHYSQYKRFDKNFNESPLYIEFGIVGWTGCYDLAAEVSRVCPYFMDDQTAMSYILMKNGRKAVLAKTPYQIIQRARAYWRWPQKTVDDVMVWHVNPAYKFWWNEARRAMKENFLGMGDMKYIKHINPIAYNLIIDGKDPK